MEKQHYSTFFSSKMLLYSQCFSFFFSLVDTDNWLQGALTEIGETDDEDDSVSENNPNSQQGLFCFIIP